ncbi:MAG: hypothetical protein ABI624_01270 [Casimicrobiaceae bacterium]
MFIVLWVFLGVVLGGSAGFMLFAGLQLTRDTLRGDGWSPLVPRGNDPALGDPAKSVAG